MQQRRDHLLCVLGRWGYSTGRQCLPQFTNIGIPHERARRPQGMCPCHRLQERREPSSAGGFYCVQREPNLRLDSLYGLPGSSCYASMPSWRLHLRLVLDPFTRQRRRTELASSFVHSVTSAHTFLFADYMNGFQCNITGSTSNVPLATAQVPRRCGADPDNGKPNAAPGNCTYGAKQPLYWFQAERNNVSFA